MQTARNERATGPLQSEPALLTDDQRGSLRHIFNLAEQLPDDWSRMLGRTTMQEDFGALRFQLAYMAYAAALTHIHRLPAAPGLFRKPLELLIEKIKSPDVWTYWHYVSTGNAPMNASLGELPPEWNPIKKDNIMYSAYLQSMALLYHYLFDDDRYARDGALTLTLRPLFWGKGPSHFVYDENSLNEHIYWEMVENGYLGVACEPNCIFQICNQVPILGFRLHDMIYGGDRAREVTDGYRQAWSEFGIVTETDHYNVFVLEKEHTVVGKASAWSDFWAGALMHAWNPGLTEAAYPKQRDCWVLPGPDGTLWVDQAKSSAFAANGLPSSLDFGWAAVCASEMGDERTLQGLLAFADKYLHRSWDKGGLFHRRHDIMYDEEGRLTGVDPHTGNALLPYARLNIPGGLRKLYEGAWDKTHFSEPAIVDIGGRFDLAAAAYDRQRNSLEWVAVPIGKTGAVRIEISNLRNRGELRLRIDGTVAAIIAGEIVSSSNAGLSVRWTEERLTVEMPLERLTNFSLS